MKKKFYFLFTILLLSAFFSVFLINSPSFKLVYEVLKINNSLPAVSSNFYNEPIKNITYKDVCYKHRDKTNLKLDIYVGNNTKPSPVILYVFGNGWTYGDKVIPSGIEPIIDILKDEGYAVISTSYELMKDEVILDKQITDIKDTLRWIYKNKDIYNFDTNNIGIIAPSAGAQLSMVAAFSEANEFIGDEELSQYPSKVKFIVDLFGPTKLDELNFSEGPKEIVEKFTQNQIHSLSNKYSPIMYLKKNLPDTLIIHSVKDNIVPYQTSVDFYTKALEYNNNFEFYTLKECTHYMENLSNEEALDLYIKIVSYIISETG